MSNSCEIVVKGYLDADWSEWLEGLTIMHNDQGETIISGPIRDQAALYGLMVKMCNLALFILSIRYVTERSSRESGDPQGHSYI